MSVKSKFCCLVCKYSTEFNGNLQKHFTSKKHLQNVDSPEIPCGNFQCKKCSKIYKVKSGLWKHNKICKSIT